MTVEILVAASILAVATQGPLVVKSVDISLPASIISIAPGTPFVAKTCVPAPPTPPPDPDDDIFVPTPPDTDIGDLPALEPETQIIDTSPDDIIGCTNKLPVGQEAQVLDAFFPSRVSGDGVVNRSNNDIWVYRNGAWQNVGPTPGPQVVVVTVVPPTNQKVSLLARTRTIIGITVKEYALELLTSLAVTTRTALSIVSDKTILPPTSSLSVLGQTPLKVGRSTRESINIEQKTGTVAPLLGATEADSVAAEEQGWTLRYDSTSDEIAIQTAEFGFDFTLDETAYSSCFVNSNSYINFGTSFSVYQNFSASNPPIPKILISPGDFSLQRLYEKKTKGAYRIRWEGSFLYNSPAGESNRFWELSFFKPLEDGTQYVELVTGSTSGSVGFGAMIATADTALASTAYLVNESLVFTGNAIGTEWSVASGQYIDYSVSLDLQAPSVSIAVEVLSPIIEAGLSVKPPAVGLAIEASAPVVFASSGIAIPNTVVQVSHFSPFSVGCRVVVQAPGQVLEVQNFAPIISTGKAVSPENKNIDASANSLSISTGVSIGLGVVPEVLASANQVTIGRLAYLEVQPTAVLVEAVAPEVAVGASVSIPSAIFSFTTLAASVKTGTSITPQNVGSDVIAIPPTVLIESGYWGEWATQSYGWDSDLYPDWWSG